MRTRLFDHIDLRVTDMKTSRPFYSLLLPALGFGIDKCGGKWGAFESSGEGPTEFFGFIEDPKHRPNESRIAFWANSRGEVDRVAEAARHAGGRNLEGPQIWPEYSPGYYAVFFEDPCGNKLEVCCRQSQIVAE